MIVVGVIKNIRIYVLFFLLYCWCIEIDMVSFEGEKNTRGLKYVGFFLWFLFLGVYKLIRI